VVRRFEIDGVEHGEHVHGDVKRRLGIVMRLRTNGVVLAEITVAGSEAKNLIVSWDITQARLPGR